MPEKKGVEMPETKEDAEAQMKDMQQQELSDWLEGLKLTKYTSSKVLMDAGLTSTIIRDMDKTVLHMILQDAKVPLFALTRIMAAAPGIDPEPDSIKQFTASSKTNPHDDDKLMAWFWIKSLLLGVFSITIPSLTIGLLDETWTKDTDDDEREDDVWTHVFIPGVLTFLLLQVFTVSLSMMFATSTLEERSLGVNHKDTMTNQLTNTGVVSALLLTVVLAALQADFPTEASNTLLNHWYVILLIIGFCYALSATAMSSITLMYMSPLEGPAVEDFISIMALYFGEPIMSMLISLWMILLSLIIWIWGQSGKAMGIFSCLVTTYIVFRATAATLNLMHYENPFVDEATRADRKVLKHRGQATPKALKALEQLGSKVENLFDVS